ncbi:MAG: helix-turn-helix domain-containing protein [Patescibacteria group bacterium]
MAEKLVALRKEANITLSEMAEKTKIRKLYLRRLEAGAYEKLPDSIYTRNFLKVYLRVLRADETYFLNLYEQERGTCDFVKQACLPRKRAGAFRFLVASKFVKIGIFFFAAASMVFYLGLQVHTITSPPKLAIFEPNDGMLTNNATIIVSGKAEDGSNVKINGSEVLMNKTGQFDVEVALERGLNVIKIEGAKRYSHSAVEYRRVVLDQNKKVTLAP